MIISYGTSCRGKHRHESPGKADAHIRALAKRGADVRQMGSYFCGYCKGYHVGHRPQSQWERVYGKSA